MPGLLGEHRCIIGLARLRDTLKRPIRQPLKCLYEHLRAHCHQAIVDFLKRHVRTDCQLTCEQHVARIQTGIHEHRRNARLLLAIDDAPLHRCSPAITR